MKLSIVLSTQPTSFSALAYTGEFEANLVKIAALGYEGVELAVRNPNSLDVKYVKRLLREQNLLVPAISTGQAYSEDGLSFAHSDEAIRREAIQRIKAHIDLASKLHANVIIGLIRGKLTETQKREQVMTWLIESLQECAYTADLYGIKILIEPINRYETNIVNSVEEALDLIEKVGVGNLGLLLDTFHMNIEEPSIEDSIRKADKQIFHFHIADSNRWYPGAGHIDFKRVTEVLHEIRYEGFLSAEILPLPDSDRCAQKTMEFMRSILEAISH